MLLDRLIAKQVALRESDIQFAKRLGIPRSTWQLTRTGRKPIGQTVARAAVRCFPELTPDAISFLLFNATVATADATPEDTQPNGDAA